MAPLNQEPQRNFPRRNLQTGDMYIEIFQRGRLYSGKFHKGNYFIY